jgi:hypothetical protein
MLMKGGRAPSGSYTYEGLGDETWDGSLSCLFDRWENKYTLREFDDMVFTEETRNDCIQYFLSGADLPEGCQLDYTGLQNMYARPSFNIHTEMK